MKDCGLSGCVFCRLAVFRCVLLLLCLEVMRSSLCRGKTEEACVGLYRLLFIESFIHIFLYIFFVLRVTKCTGRYWCLFFFDIRADVVFVVICMTCL